MLLLKVIPIIEMVFSYDFDLNQTFAIIKLFIEIINLSLCWQIIYNKLKARLFHYFLEWKFKRSFYLLSDNF